MAQMVPAEVADPGAIENLFPRRLKSDGDTKHTRSSSRGVFLNGSPNLRGSLDRFSLPAVLIRYDSTEIAEEPHLEYLACLSKPCRRGGAATAPLRDRRTPAPGVG
jgi:hypothetical protein